ncbi:hypothetical protein JW992_04560 [candidate division KSB1 bacterium]|nr:hypothetical protein [candidate division KSB1 bacterium]
MCSNEVDNLLALTEGNVLKAVEILEKQLNTLYMRAQVLMSLAGVTLTITGFSGRLIAGTNRTAQFLVIAGLAVVLTSAVWVYIRVMGVKWITADVQADSRLFIGGIINRRNHKTFAYSLGGKILLVGMTLYCIAFSIMLFHT